VTNPKAENAYPWHTKILLGLLFGARGGGVPNLLWHDAGPLE